MRNRLPIFFTGILIFSVSLLGCSQPALNVKPIAKTENPSALLEKLAQDLSTAKEKRVDLLSPTWFAKAQASHAKAKAELNQGAELSKILANIANGRAQLAQASGSADNAAKYLASAIKSRDAALAAGADRYKKPFANLENDFRNLTKGVEEDDLGYVRKKRKVVDSQYRELELRAIKDDHLAEVRRLMQVAASEEMDDAAPKSYLVAQSKLADAERIISKNRYDKAAIDKAVGQARFYAQRLHQLAGVSKKVEKMAPEEIALWMEDILAQTNAHLYESDRRNLPFKDQQDVILAAISTLQRNRSASSSMVQSKDLEIEKLNQRIARLEGRTYQARADKERLEAEKRFNEIYTQVQGYFSADQAEVYKKAQHLVIRLKAMRFPVGQAVVVSSNYPLLTTVRKAIRAFGRPDVVIEGHTDSTGSESLNQKLSRSRAESVRQYLIQNGTLSADKISAEGYGSSRPLASNATARGRAVNRRIDVIIKPVR